MKKIILIVAGSIFACSCSKKEETQPNSSQYQYDPISQKRGGDDDEPIIRETVVDVEGNPLSSAVITYTQGNYAPQGTTGVTGIFTFTLPSFGQWSLNIVKPGYIPVNSSVNITDSFTTRIDTMAVL